MLSRPHNGFSFLPPVKLVLYFDTAVLTPFSFQSEKVDLRVKIRGFSSYHSMFFYSFQHGPEPRLHLLTEILAIVSGVIE